MIRGLSHLSYEVARRAGLNNAASFLYDASLLTPFDTDLDYSKSPLGEGDAGQGRWIMNSVFSLFGDNYNFDPALSWAQAPIDNPVWRMHVHGFDWLQDLRAVGGEHARKSARAMLNEWMMYNGKWVEQSWDVSITGRRVCNWIFMYDFIITGADKDFRRQYMQSLSKQLMHLKKNLGSTTKGVERLSAAMGLVCGSLCAPSFHKSFDDAFCVMQTMLKNTMLSDGGINTRNPSDLATLLRRVQDVLMFMQGAPNLKDEHVAFLNDYQSYLTAALRLFRHGDKKLSVFHGGWENNDTVLDQTLGRSPNQSKIAKSLPYMGFERLSQSKSVIIADTGYTHRDADSIHSSPLSFEFSHGRDRLIVNCGTHYTCVDWQERLRATVAHSTAIVNDKNAMIHDPDAERHFPQRWEKDGATFLDMTHDGYKRSMDLRHRRVLCLNDKGTSFRGIDRLIRETNLDGTATVDIRFHIHPRVSAVMTNNNSEVLLKTGSGMGWRFWAEGAQISCDESIYMGSDYRPRRTKQIVLHQPNAGGAISEILWAFEAL